MNFNSALANISEERQSLLCVGLDIDERRLPPALASDRDHVVSFAREIIEATHAHACAYKINVAFLEAQGPQAWDRLAQVRTLVPGSVLVIADAKRSDIGNSAEQYARAFFSQMDFDAITVSPYMGYDAVAPFIADPERGAFVLCLTSNPGAEDFQYLACDGEPLYRHVARQVDSWNDNGNCGLVVGATRPADFGDLRKRCPELPFLVPGIGAQGGDLAAVLEAGLDERGAGLLINVGRTIIYASNESDFAEAAAAEAARAQAEINRLKAT